MEAFKRWFFNPNALAVYRSVRDTPHDWDGERHERHTLYYLTHQKTNLHLWTANGLAGMEIKDRYHGRILFGGVTMLGTMGLSPGHWLLYRAKKLWERAHQHHKPPKVTAETILFGGTSHPRSIKVRNERRAFSWLKGK